MTGTVLPYALASTPAGWLLCDGSALTSGTPDRLRQALIDDGSPYGDDGSGNPLLPDPSGRHILGAGAGASLTTPALGDTGDEAVALALEEMPEHGHDLDTETLDTAGSGATQNNMPPFVVVNHIIKA